MYEKYTQQSLPTKNYRELLGTSVCVFNSNNAFIIENILHIDNENFNWYELMDRTSGKLMTSVKNTITKESDHKIESLFSDLVDRRNRIIHSFQVTKNDEQVLHTKDKNNKQYAITEKYLMDFIKDNSILSSMLHNFRLFNQKEA